MAVLSLRVPDVVLERFDIWAGAHGGRSPALRHLIDRAVSTSTSVADLTDQLPKRPVKLSVRLSVDDAVGLAEAATEWGLTPNAWVAALVRRRLRGRPTFKPSDTVSLIAIQVELRRIGGNVNQIARALNSAVLEGEVLELEVAYLADLRAELQAHMRSLRDAFAGNFADWDVEP